MSLRKDVGKMGGDWMVELKNEFGYNPFSVLDSNDSYWVKKKREWLSLGIRPEIGRESIKLFGDHYGRYERRWGRLPTVSVFDPFLTELMYRWFCPAGGRILDLFAGGSVRGIVAEKLGYRYVGIELRKEQVESNVEQAEQIGVNPVWVVGDSMKIDELIDENEKFDMIFTCPPYWNLEIYSDLEEDLSNCRSYDEFLEKYKEIFRKGIRYLRDNRFVVVVVGNFRDKRTGELYDLAGDTVRVMKEIGLRFYNDIIYIQSQATLPIRVRRFFKKHRKIGRTHQYVLVFWKGDLDKIVDLGEIGEKYEVKSLFDYGGGEE